MSKELMADDVLDLLAYIARGFRTIGMEPPSVIMLKSGEEGRRFLTAMHQKQNWVAVVGSATLGTPIEMADGTVYMSMEVMGMQVRWPASRYAMPDGSWKMA